MDEYITFYREWLPLPKAEFNILAMLAERGGSFSGNYSDMCRYLGVTPQQANRRRIQAAIDPLKAAGFITHESQNRTQILKTIPKATEILLSRLWVQSVIRHDYSGENVAFAQVLKVFAWVVENKTTVITNDMIAAELNVSTSTVVSAKNVLKREYEIVRQRDVSVKLGENAFRKLGQELAANAWWNEI